MGRTLALLVGGNPLPNYLAAEILKKERPWDRAVLFFTPQTEAVKRRLKTALEQLGPVEDRFIQDPASRESVREAWKGLPRPVHLHYTGGTKTMAVHLYTRWFEDAREDPTWQKEASYLDEGSEALRFDDGTARRLEDLDLQLELAFLAELHGLEKLKTGRTLEGGPVLPDDAQAMAISLFKDPANAGRIYDCVPAPDKRARLDAERPIDLGVFGIQGLSRDAIPAPGWSYPVEEAWLRFLRGVWLEPWVGELIRKLKPDDHVVVDVNAKIDTRPFQVDMVALRRHRIYAISCTTASRPGQCKTKLFEVAFRARQLGGDLARSALVCFLEEHLEDVQKDVETGWEATNEPRVFGLQHLREWQARRTETLTDWLER